MRQFYVYILSSHSRRLYVGVTNNLHRRVFEHAQGLSTFTAQYKIRRLVHYEVFDRPMAAIRREKQLKHMLRREKIELIESVNAGWLDLAAGWFDPPDD
jgi:putative endonuclease